MEVAHDALDSTTSTRSPRSAGVGLQAKPSLAAGVVAVSAGDEHTCAVTTAGGVKCWGLNGGGQLGAQTSELCPGTGLSSRVPCSPIPIDVVGLDTGVVAIAAGSSHTCALTASGGVKCWGSIVGGQLGDKTVIERVTPEDVCEVFNEIKQECTQMLSDVAAIEAGGGHTCALTTTGGVKCWGWYRLHEGNKMTATSDTPVDVPGLTSSIAAIDTAFAHSCAVTTAGGVTCWGDDTSGWGYLGELSTLQSGVAAITAGAAHTCALTTTGGVKCWGNNFFGQLGGGTPTGPLTGHPTPVDVTGLDAVAAVSAGGNHTCALTTAGGVSCWGMNTVGQLGDGMRTATLTGRITPADVVGLRGDIIDVAAGGAYTCAVTALGGVMCWGLNSTGQLGDATTNDSTTPVGVVGLGVTLPSTGIGSALGGGRAATWLITLLATAGAFALGSATWQAWKPGRP